MPLAALRKISPADALVYILVQLRRRHRRAALVTKVLLVIGLSLGLGVMALAPLTGAGLIPRAPSAPH